jgi:CheY-like chemotaxis protein
MRTPLRLLLVEDNPLDADLAREYIQETGCPVEVVTVNDGEKAVEFFDRVSRQEEDRPHIVLLDINLPRINGNKVLEHIRTVLGDDVIVYMYSGSRSPLDMKRAEGRANGFIVKPMGDEIEEFIGQLRGVLASLGAECG